MFVKLFIIVLIESDWNLKAETQAQTSIAIEVLIESDWNLKVFLIIHIACIVQY